jgi:hypothetical protein
MEDTNHGSSKNVCRSRQHRQNDQGRRQVTQAKADMDAAAKEAQAEARAKSKTPVKKDATMTATSNSKPSLPAKAPTEPIQSPLPRTASLFDMPDAAVAPAAPSAAPVKAELAEEEEEILTEIEEGETEDDESLDEAA